MKKKYINPTAQAIQLEINPLLQNVLSPNTDQEQTVDGNSSGGGGSKGFIISNDEPEYDEEL
jgi:hypothetical protein